jgi:succinate-acetate transporter protein
VSLGTADLDKDIGWSLLGFAFFNTYTLASSTRVNRAVFTVFLLPETSEIILFIGFFLAGAGHSRGAIWIKVGGYVGVATAAMAWYTSAAVVVNNVAGRTVMPVGQAMRRDRAAIAPPAASGARVSRT